MNNVDSELVRKLAEKYPQDLLLRAATLYGQPLRDNGVPSGRYATIHAKGQRDALRAVQRLIDDLEFRRGKSVPRALKDAVREQLENLPGPDDESAQS